jgi:predicted membrane protein (TIGR00267 family)
MSIPHRAEYLHHQNPGLGATIREAVFGIEDGMVSTLGSITGIAAATGSTFTILLSGLVIVAVESISMAVGSYLSTKSQRAVDERKLHEERGELKEYPEEEKQELIGMYVQDGWPQTLAEQMAETASQNKQLFLQEMAYRELKIFPDQLEQPVSNALVMGVAYILGGSVPLLPYFFLHINDSFSFSIIVTLIGLFVVGAITTKFSHRTWWKAGLEMTVLAGVAALVGYGVGQAVELLLA